MSWSRCHFIDTFPSNDLLFGFGLHTVFAYLHWSMCQHPAQFLRWLLDGVFISLPQQTVGNIDTDLLSDIHTGCCNFTEMYKMISINCTLLSGQYNVKLYLSTFPIFNADPFLVSIDHCPALLQQSWHTQKVEVVHLAVATLLQHSPHPTGTIICHLNTDVVHSLEAITFALWNADFQWYFPPL